MKNNVFTQFQKAAFSIGCGFFAMTLLTQSLSAIQKGLGAALPFVIQGEWIIIIICFGSSGLFGLRLSGDVRDVIKKRMEGLEELKNESTPHRRKLPHERDPDLLDSSGNAD